MGALCARFYAVHKSALTFNSQLAIGFKSLEYSWTLFQEENNCIKQ